MKSTLSSRLVVLALVASVLAGCASEKDLAQPELAEEPTRTAIAHEVETATDPRDLAALSDAVIVGSVTSVKAGRARGDLPEEKMVDRLVQVSISEVIVQADGSRTLKPGQVIDVHEGYWDADGEGLVINEVEWSGVGDQAIYFLHRMDGEEIYRLAISYGRVLFPRSHDEVSGPSGIAPYESVWRQAQGKLVGLRSAIDYLQPIVGPR